MKRALTLALSAMLTISAAGAVWAADVPSNVGVAAGELPEAFQGKEALLEENCKKAYAWALQLHAKEPEDGGFRFGESTDELLHFKDFTLNGIEEQCIIQDFDGGNSSADKAFTYTNWAALVCVDPETCEVLILRDTPAEYFSRGGGVSNLPFGLPTTNQYWRMEEDIPVLYQQFENGYLRVEKGESYFAEFHNFLSEGDFYEEPPQPPMAYGPVDEPSPDGCTWENPLYIGWNAGEESSSSDTAGTESESRPESVISDPGSDAFVDESAPADETTSDTATAGGTDASAPDESASAPAAETSDTALSSEESRTSGSPGPNADTSDTGGGWNAGLMAGIAAGAVVIAGGGFCLYWFILRNKKAALVPEGQSSEKNDDDN